MGDVEVHGKAGCGLKPDGDAGEAKFVGHVLGEEHEDVREDAGRGVVGMEKFGNKGFERGGHVAIDRLRKHSQVCHAVVVRWEAVGDVDEADRLFVGLGLGL